MKAKPAPACGYLIGYEHYRPITCGRPPLIRIYRRELGRLDICARHMDSPELYADVKAHKWRWKLIGSAP